MKLADGQQDDTKLFDWIMFDSDDEATTLVEIQDAVERLCGAVPDFLSFDSNRHFPDDWEDWSQEKEDAYYDLIDRALDYIEVNCKYANDPDVTYWRFEQEYRIEFYTEET